jgi:hypothetical protein
MTIVAASQQQTSARAEAAGQRTVRQAGTLAAALTGVLAAAWPLALVIESIGAPPPGWRGIEAFAQGFRPIEMLNLVPSLPLASAYVVMLACLHMRTPAHRRLWSLLGLTFGIIYAVMASANYLIQFIVVRPNLLQGEVEGLSLFVMGNPRSVFWALAVSYAYMALSMLFASGALGAGRLERWARGLFLAVGATAPLQFAGMLSYSATGQVPLAAAVASLVWIVGVPASAVLLARVFWRETATGGEA